MANNCFCQQIRRIGIAHFPTVMLAIGYLVYWLELYALPNRAGVTTPLAWGLFVIFCVANLYVVKRGQQDDETLAGEFCKQPRLVRAMIIFGLLLACLIAGIIFYAALLPPHFPQEDDALRYHLSLPRQHLILGSFFYYITWDWADLTVMPIDYALAPYCFINEMPNKFAHFIVLLGLVGVVVNLTRRFSHGKWTGATLAVLAVLGSHGLGIQFGTAMLDIIICYLFLAALESFLSGKIFLGLIEFTFFFWSKAFVPIQMVLIILVMAGVYAAGRGMFHEACWGFGEKGSSFDLRTIKKIIIPYGSVFVLLSAVIAGPFLIKSLCYAGTPIYPFATGMVKPFLLSLQSEQWQDIVATGRSLMEFKDSYGYGRSLGAFLKHFFLISVPESGVNNKYDYPLGLPYLLCLVPFLSCTWNELRNRRYPILAFFTLLFWATWWMGSQQSRFFYIPMTVMIILVCSRIRSIKIFLGALIIALMFNLLSITRNHKGDWFRPRKDLIGESDKVILEINKEYLLKERKDVVVLDHPRISFARFPVIYKRKTD